MLKFSPLLVVAILCLAMTACDSPRETDSKAAVPAINAPSNAAHEGLKNMERSAPVVNIPVVDAKNLQEAFTLAESDFAAARYEDRHGVAPSALEWYSGILRFDADNIRAQAGLKNTVDALVQITQQKIRDGDLDEASRLLAVVEFGLAAHPDIALLKSELAKAEQADIWQQKAVALEKSKQILATDSGGTADNAVDAYRNALKAFPVYQPALQALDRLRSQRERAALSLAKKDKYEAALIALKQAEAVDGENPQYRLVSNHVRGRLNQLVQEQVVLANLALDGMRIEQAEKNYQNAKKIVSTHPDVAALATRIDDTRHYARHRAHQVFTEAWAMSNPAPELVVIPYGQFDMGARQGNAERTSELPLHRVTFKRGFAIARNEITVGQFRQFIESSAYRTRATTRGWSMVFDEKGGSMTKRENIDWHHDHLGRVAKDDLPVVHVNLGDAQAYAEWLSEKTGATYRVPSEAEFEYVLRAGKETLYPWGNAAPKRVVANLAGAGDKSTQSRSWGNAIAGYRDFHWGGAPARSFPEEPWGTFDISGNVEEWVQDCWHDSYQRAPTDGSAWVNPGCKMGVTRGASWASSLEEAESSFRMATPMKTHNARIGFRVVRAL